MTSLFTLQLFLLKQVFQILFVLVPEEEQFLVNYLHKILDNKGLVHSSMNECFAISQAMSELMLLRKELDIIIIPDMGS